MKCIRAIFIYYIKVMHNQPPTEALFVANYYTVYFMLLCHLFLHYLQFFMIKQFYQFTKPKVF